MLRASVIRLPSVGLLQIYTNCIGAGAELGSKSFFVLIFLLKNQN